jgi:dynein heavy chain
MGELYGEENVDTKEWTDGLASKIIRKFAKDDENVPNPRRSWCIFDGPVDALWIENMNTVLDDNMTLCLANGERIKLKWTMRMLFEVQDLDVASPATVSRCGMVYMTPSELGWRPYLSTWVRSFAMEKGLLHEEAAVALEELFSFYFEECWVKLKAHVKDEEPMPTVPVQIVRCICNFLEYFLKSSKQAVPIHDKREVWLKKLNYYFGFSFIWGFGASYKTNAIRYVDNIMRDFFGKLHFPL